MFKKLEVIRSFQEQHFFSFFPNASQRSTEYLSRAKGKKYRTSEASTGDFLPGE